MPEPLDYFNPMPPHRGHRPERRERPAAAIPVEFEAVLTRTTDVAGARAVEAELTRQQVRFFTTATGGFEPGGVVEIRVRAPDHAYASQLAAMVFARRKRLDQIDPRRPAPGPPLPDDD